MRCLSCIQCRAGLPKSHQLVNQTNPVDHDLELDRKRYSVQSAKTFDHEETDLMGDGKRREPEQKHDYQPNPKFKMNEELTAEMTATDSDIKANVPNRNSVCRISIQQYVYLNAELSVLESGWDRSGGGVSLRIWLWD